MAIGDATDIGVRLRQLVPPWFPGAGSSPIVDALIAGIATLLANVYALIAFARLQSRIKSATGAFLDLIAWDYFGPRFGRLPGEIDVAFVARILPELIRERVTRSAIQAALVELTGFPVRVVEAWKPSDVGAIDRMYVDVDTAANPGRIGEPGLSCQFFIECVLPLVQPFGNNVQPAIDINLYIDTPPTGYILDAATTTVLGAQSVFNLINAMRAAGITVWLRFVPIPTALQWDLPGLTWDATGATWA